MEVSKLISSMYGMKNVKRMSGTPILQGYNLMEHSFMVANLFYIFAKEEDVAYTGNELVRILNHDLCEVVTGDCIYTVKNRSEKTKECWEQIEEECLKTESNLSRFSDKNIKESLNSRQYVLFKTCDILELLLFILSEQKLGNKSDNLLTIRDRCIDILNNYCQENNFKKIIKFVQSCV